MPSTDYAAGVFTKEQIAEAIEALTDYERYETIATLTNGNYSPAVISQFASLARAMELGVTTVYNGLAIQREYSPAKLKKTAVQNLQYKSEHGEL